MDQKSPRSDHMNRVLPPQLQSKEHHELRKLAESTSKYDPLTGKPTTKQQFEEIDINDRDQMDRINQQMIERKNRKNYSPTRI
jgi:hypothetical protein